MLSKKFFVIKLAVKNDSVLLLVRVLLKQIYNRQVV